MTAQINRQKTWCLPVLDQNQVRELATELNISEALASVHMVRGLDSAESIRDFCDLSLTKIHDPYLLPDMQPAVDRLIKAIYQYELIQVVGDGDCDGVCSTALACYAIEAMGGNVDWHVPSRLTEGFGLSRKSVDIALENGASVLLSVDCGIEGFEAAKHAKLHGIDLIITDHHEPRNDGAIPDCVACINPKRRNSLQSFTQLAGVGVVFKLMLALCEGMKHNVDSAFDQLIEYVAIGTCADVVSMTSENRVMVDYGCKKLSTTEKTGLRKLIASAGVRKVDSESIGYFLAPMINAACRLGEPGIAVNLLLESDELEAERLADALKLMNGERKALQDDLLHYILETVTENDASRNIQLFAGDNWHRGLIGLVAGNITSASGKPSIICSIDDDGTVYGSCRSTSNFNILEALDYCANLLSSYGGHVQAAGFKLHIDNMSELVDRLDEYASQIFGDTPLVDVLEIDAELDFKEITEEIHMALECLAPFGPDNSQPKFYSPGMVVKESSAFCGGKHLKLSLTGLNDTRIINAVGWNLGHLANDIVNGLVVDVVYSLEMDTYKCDPTLRLRIADIDSAR